MTLKNLFSHTLKCLHSTHLYDKSEFPRNVPDTTPLAVQRLSPETASVTTADHVDKMVSSDKRYNIYVSLITRPI